MLDAPMHLCARADGDATRSSLGQVTQLSVYDTALSRNDVRRLYSAVKDMLDAAQSEWGQCTVQDALWHLSRQGV